MSADLTCPTCKGTGEFDCPRCDETHPCPRQGCDGSRRRPELDEWDALEERCEAAERNLQSACKFNDLVVELHERACHERNALQAERDRYREALERIAAMYAPGAFGIQPVIDHAVAVARVALDSDPDMAERTQERP